MEPRLPGRESHAQRVDAERYGADKPENYLRTYQELFRPFVDRGIRLLELGVRRGGSLLMWRDYFEQGIIAGIDLSVPKIDDPTGRIRVFEGLQQDTAFLDRVASAVAPEGFDVIIDDASHVGEFTRIAFWHLFSHHLKPGGLYAIEDWGVGYWPSREDGGVYQPAPFQPRPGAVQRRFPSHDFGMVGFLKELIDECGAEDISDPDKGGVTPFRNSRFESILIGWSLAVVTKRDLGGR